MCNVMAMPADEGADSPALAMVFQMDEESAAGGFDTWSEVTGVRASKLKDRWEVYSKDSVMVKGAGGRKELGRRVKVPVQMRYGSEQVFVLTRVMDDDDIPDNIDMILVLVRSKR